MDNIKIWVVSRERIEYDEEDFRLFFREDDALRYVDMYPEYKVRLGVSKNVMYIYDMLNNKDEYMNEKYKGSYVYYKYYSNDNKSVLKIGIINEIYKSKVRYVCTSGIGRCYCDENNEPRDNCRYLYMDEDLGGKDMKDHLCIHDLNSYGHINFYFGKYSNDLSGVEDDLYLLNIKTKKSVKIKNYVYFIQETTTKAIKIGTTTNVKTRLSQLQTSTPLKLSLLKVIKGGTDVEKMLHIKFNKYRMMGEWFELHDELIEYIDKEKGLKKY